MQRKTQDAGNEPIIHQLNIPHRGGTACVCLSLNACAASSLKFDLLRS